MSAAFEAVLAKVNAVQVTDKEPTYEKDGAWYLTNWAGKWTKVPFLTELACGHEITVCRDCLDQWASDHLVMLVLDDGKEMSLQALIDNDLA